MIISWKQHKSLPHVQYFRTPYGIGMAKPMCEIENSPTVAKYKTTRLETKGMTVEEKREVDISWFRFWWYRFLGLTPKDIITEVFGGSYFSYSETIN